MSRVRDRSSPSQAEGLPSMSAASPSLGVERCGGLVIHPSFPLDAAHTRPTTFSPPRKIHFYS